MTNLEEGVRNTLERLEKKYNEIEKELQENGFESSKDSFKVGYQLGLDLAISFLKTDLKFSGEKNGNEK